MDNLLLILILILIAGNFVILFFLFKNKPKQDYDINEKINLYANYGKTYRIPTYTDLY